MSVYSHPAFSKQKRSSDISIDGGVAPILAIGAMSLLLVVLTLLLIQLYRSTSKLERERNQKQETPNLFDDPAKRYKRSTSLPRKQEILVTAYPKSLKILSNSDDQETEIEGDITKPEYAFSPSSVNIRDSVISKSDEFRFSLAILDYLASNGLDRSFEAFSSEIGIQHEQPAITDILEKKWTSVLRLQKKIGELESKILELEAEVNAQPFHKKAGKTEYSIPNDKEKFVLKSHSRGVNSITFHPSSGYLASASDDAAIKIWDFETGSFEKTLKGHTQPVQDVIFTPDGQYLVSCSNDLSIKVWDVSNNYTCVRTLHGHDHAISGICFIPQSDLLVSVSRDSTVRVWEFSTGLVDINIRFCIKTLSGHSDWIRCLDYSEKLAMLATAGNDQSIILWNTSNWTEIRTMTGHEHVIENIQFAPAKSNESISKLLNVTQAIDYLASVSRDRHIKIWNIQSGECIHSLTGHENWVRGLCFYPSGLLLATVSDDCTLRIWNLVEGRAIKTIKSHTQFVSCVQVHPSLPLLVTGSMDQTVKCWMLS
ncbi:Platelet-activating factor acetylhydrolase IB subunit alpha [Terramyces sp. JEL0728]|nr:Platelet-activating factor acetylhydrolase IB subunit alpha [Terramyces sp. JEL0728]